MLTLLKIIAWVAGHIPAAVARRMGRLLGSLAYRIDKRHRKTVKDNLSKAYHGRMTEAEMDAVARGVFVGLGQTAFEFMRVPWLNASAIEKFVACEGREHLDAALKKGRGVILYTAHFGDWELLAAWYGLMGYPLDIVARELDNPAVDAFVAWARARPGNRVVSKNRSMRKLLKTLASNGIAGILLDQNVAEAEGVFVDFFGVPACTNKGPAMLAAMSKAAVLPTFIVRKGARHTVVIGPEITLASTGDKGRDAVENTARFTRPIEEVIRKYPEQWFWVHRRWKTRPTPPTPSYPA